VASELYSMNPAAFVAARTAAARQARTAGDRALASAIGRLRRPTSSAWAVNLLVRAAGVDVAELLALGEALRAAQQQLQGDQLRQLNQRRRELLGALAQRARQLAADAGHPLGAPASVEVEQTLAAALVDPAAAEAVRAGQLARPLQHVGLGPEPSTAALAARPAEPRPVPPTRPSPSTVEETARRRGERNERLTRDLEQARQELSAARQRTEAAEQQAREAAERAAQAERRLIAAQRDREQAERECADAQHRARSAARARDEAQQRLQRLTDQRHAAQ
jgi:hypothetical protein